VKHVCKFENEGSPDELYGFLNDLLVEQKFGQVGVPSIEQFGSGETVGVIYDDVMDTVTLVSSSHESLLDPEDDA
jgi:hypothetical protein